MSCFIFNCAVIADMWGYGAVHVRPASLAFVFQASRPDRSMVFFNVCTSIYVPLKDEGTDVSETEVLFFVVGSRGKADDGMDVYDIVVHPTVAVKSTSIHASVYKRKVQNLFLVLFFLLKSFFAFLRNISNALLAPCRFASK